MALYISMSELVEIDVISITLMILRTYFALFLVDIVRVLFILPHNFNYDLRTSFFTFQLGISFSRTRKNVRNVFCVKSVGF